MGGPCVLGSLSVEETMAVGEAGPVNRIKATAPYLGAAAAVIVAVVAGTVLGNGNEASAPPSDAARAEANLETPPTSDDTPTPQAGSSIPGVAFDQPPPAGVAQGVEIVVKFKDDAKVKDIIDAFWRDPASAGAKFDALKARRPEFANLRLDRVTYSNELVLVHDGGAPADQRLAAMRGIAAKLKSVSDISYAEPNMTAQPGGQ